MKTDDKRKQWRRQYPFRRKSEENPYEALERLDKKLVALMDERQHWLKRISPFAINVVNRLEEEYRLLIAERNTLLGEVTERHKELGQVFPEANLIYI